jgi:hypothetical protein
MDNIKIIDELFARIGRSSVLLAPVDEADEVSAGFWDVCKTDPIGASLDMTLICMQGPNMGHQLIDTMLDAGAVRCWVTREGVAEWVKERFDSLEAYRRTRKAALAPDTQKAKEAALKGYSHDIRESDPGFMMWMVLQSMVWCDAVSASELPTDPKIIKMLKQHTLFEPDFMLVAAKKERIEWPEKEVRRLVGDKGDEPIWFELHIPNTGVLLYGRKCDVNPFGDGYGYQLLQPVFNCGCLFLRVVATMYGGSTEQNERALRTLVAQLKRHIKSALGESTKGLSAEAMSHGYSRARRIFSFYQHNQAGQGSLNQEEAP